MVILSGSVGNGLVAHLMTGTVLVPDQTMQRLRLNCAHYLAIDYKPYGPFCFKCCQNGWWVLEHGLVSEDEQEVYL